MVSPEEDEVALVVQRGDLPAAEAGVLVEERGKHAPQAVPQPGVEVVQHQLRLRPGSPPMPLRMPGGRAVTPLSLTPAVQAICTLNQHRSQALFDTRICSFD